MGWLFLEEEVNKETRTADEAVADGRCYGFGAWGAARDCGDGAP
jgi:hypothetical protein